MARLRWLVALGVALAVHGVILVGVSQTVSTSGAKAKGREGIVVGLAPPGSVAGAATPAAPPPRPQPPTESEPVPEVEAKPPAREHPATAQPLARAEAREQTDARVAEREPEPEPEPEAKPEPEKKAEPEPREPPEEQAEREPDAEPEETAETQARERSPEPTAQAGETGQAGAGGGEATAASKGRRGGGNPGARADYMARLQAHLSRHKEYPARARARRLEGIVTVAFMIHPDGAITEPRVVESSGASILDRAAARMLERADPAPAFPDTMAPRAREITVPVRYGLR